MNGGFIINLDYNVGNSDPWKDKSLKYAYGLSADLNCSVAEVCDGPQPLSATNAWNEPEVKTVDLIPLWTRAGVINIFVSRATYCMYFFVQPGEYYWNYFKGLNETRIKFRQQLHPHDIIM